MKVEDTVDNTLEGGDCDKDKPTDPQQDLPAGTSVGRFVLLNQLGKGGMGVVYKAYDPELDRRIAVKLLTVQPLEGETYSQPRDRLVREAQALAKLNHPNVVAVYDVGTFGTGVYVAMEFVKGKTLRNWLREQKQAFEEILQVFIAAGQGLLAAHEQGIIHRDFKPENVMVGEKNRVWILDFGVAKAASNKRENAIPQSASPLETPSEVPLLNVNLTHARGYVGTVAYMAPEQLFGRAVTEQSDQFSFCVALYEALYGTRPFSGKSISQIEQCILKDEVVFPEKSGVPRYLTQILARGLSKKAKDRYPSMEALLDKLKHDPEEIAQKRSSARKRKFLLISLVVCTIALPIVIWHGLRYRTFHLCKAAEGEFETVWDNATKTTMRETFLATGKFFALETWERVEKTIDHYLTEWMQLRSDVCEARLIRGTQSEELFDLQMSCLKTRKHELKALTNIFTRADTGVVQKAVQASSSLTRIASCADEKALRAPYPPPKTAPAKAMVATIRNRIVDIEALRKTGKYREGLELAQQVALSAKAVDYRPVQAELLFQLGVLYERVGEYKTAEKVFYQAEDAAAESKDALLTAKVMAHLVNIVGDQQARFEEGILLARDAEAMLKVAGNDKRTLAQIFNNLAGLYYCKGNYVKALDFYRQALSMREKVLGFKHPVRAKTLNNMGATYYNLGEYTKALQCYHEALALQKKVLGSQHPDLAYSLNNIGNVLREQGEYRKAIGYLQQSLKFKEKLLGSEHPLVASTLYNLGATYQNLAEYQKSMEHFRKALSIWENALGPQHPLVAYALNGIGSVLTDQGTPTRALDPLERAASLCEKKSCEPESKGQTLFVLAKALMATNGDKQRAIGLAQQAKSLFEKTPKAFKKETEEVNSWLKDLKKK